MTRTTQALKRLGVAAIAFATIGAGVPALVATSASANNTNNTGVTITPTIETNVVNDCNPFTVTVAPADTTTVDIQISQTTATGTAAIAFCNPQTDQGPGSQAGPNGPTTTTDIAGFVRPNNAGPTPATQCAPPSSGSTVTCTAEYTTNAAGQLTFGVTSNTTGTLNVTAFVETNNSAATPGFGTYNTTGNNVPGGTGENQATATKNLVTNANNAVTSIECTPPSGNQNVGTLATFTCTAFSTVGANTRVPTRGVTVSNIINSGPDKSSNLTQNDAAITCGQPTTATPPTVTTGTTTGNRTNNQGRVFCSFTNNGQPGTDNIVSYVEQNGTAGPQGTEPNTSIQRTFAGAARFINCTPKNPTVRYGIDQTITCTVTDLNNNPVNGVVVDFQASFPGGRFTDNAANNTTKTTNASGVVTVTINNPDQTSTQTQTVTATIRGGLNPDGTANTNAECNRPAGATFQPGQTGSGAAAGKCQDVVTISYTNTTASPSATPTSTTSPAPGCTTAQSNLPVRFNAPSARVSRTGATGPVVNATALVTVTVTGATPNGVVELEAYQQNHFGTANFANAGNTRTATANASGVATFQVRFSSNARARAKMQGCAFGANSGFNQGSNGAASNVLYVRTVITFTVTRVGTRTIRIVGDSIPARPGGLIVNIHCTDARCKSASNPNGILFQPRANATTGEFGPVTYTFARVFQNNRVTLYAATGRQDTGEGDAQNVAGRSNNRSVLVF